jgi:hypothetical protein
MAVKFTVSRLYESELEEEFYEKRPFYCGHFGEHVLFLVVSMPCLSHVACLHGTFVLSDLSGFDVKIKFVALTDSLFFVGSSLFSFGASNAGSSSSFSFKSADSSTDPPKGMLLKMEYIA